MLKFSTRIAVTSNMVPARRFFSYKKDAGSDVGAHGDDTLVVVQDEFDYIAVVNSQRVIIGYLTREVALRADRHIAKRAEIAGVSRYEMTLKTFLAHERGLAARAEEQNQG